MKIKAFACLVLVLGIISPSVGQAPGYLGKKAIIAFNLSSSVAFNGPTQNNRGKDGFGEPSGNYGVNYEFEGSFSYVIGRYSSLELAVSQYYTGVASSAETPALPLDLLDNGMDNHDLFHRLNVKSISLVYSKFKSNKGALAPIGNRLYYGLKRNSVSGSILDKRTNFYQENLGLVLGHQPLNINQKMNIYYALVGWSNTQIFWDKMTFTTGLRFAIPLKLNLENYFDQDPRLHIDYFDDPNKALFETNVSSRINYHEVFRLNIGIGYLLF